jgi:sec-independent protein translocase protein TatB
MLESRAPGRAQLGRVICGLPGERVCYTTGFPAMFNIGFGELAVICIVLIIAVGPERLPSMMKTLGKTLRTLRQASRDIRASTGIDDLMREDFDFNTPVRRPWVPPVPPVASEQTISRAELQASSPAQPYIDHAAIPAQPTLPSDAPMPDPTPGAVANVQPEAVVAPTANAQADAVIAATANAQADAVVAATANAQADAVLPPTIAANVAAANLAPPNLAAPDIAPTVVAEAQPAPPKPPHGS